MVIAYNLTSRERQLIFRDPSVIGSLGRFGKDTLNDWSNQGKSEISHFNNNFIASLFFHNESTSKYMIMLEAIGGYYEIM
ncbi:MAG TPA: hypothetical protein VIK78_13030 [Ruminiclostridium sp.]